MPMPWKKTRVGRISQMVADLQSPKRGGSLVVQTGFPTSLIDLFVKNRDRMRKQSRKQRENTNVEKSSDFDHSDRVADQVSDPIMTSSELGSGHLSILARPSSAKTEDLNQEDADFGISAGTDSESCELFEDCVGVGGDGNWGLVMVPAAKVLAVVVLALCTTELAVGVTLFAFLLLFLEFLGKRFVFFMIPCCNAKSAVRKMVESVCAFVIVLRGDVVVSENSEGDVVVSENSEGAVFEIVESEASIQEIEVIEHSISSRSRSSNSSVGIDEGVNQRILIEDDKWVKVEDCDHGDELLVSVCQKSTNKRKGKKKCVKMGARLINKIVPKKLRTMSKKSQVRLELEQSSEDCVYMEEDRLEEQDENQTDGFSIEGEKSVNSSSVSSLSSEHKCERGADEISDHCEVETSSVHLVVGKKGTENKENFGYMILFSIALAGLVGGRILALMLIITWCFVLKVIKVWSRSGDVVYAHEKVSSPS